MGISIRTTAKALEAAEFIVSLISKQLELGKRVLFFVPGGSAIAVVLKVAEILKDQPHSNLVVTLTDERYGEVNHFNSNFFQLTEKGFNLPEAKIIPVLNGESRDDTTHKFNQILKEELENAEYKIGLFGVGVDGHTAGMLPGSGAVESADLAYSYDTPIFSRITITPKVIEKLDEAVVWARGEEKWGVIKDLYKDIELNKQPAQVLKKVPLLTIFTDYVN